MDPHQAGRSCRTDILDSVDQAQSLNISWVDLDALVREVAQICVPYLTGT